MVLVRGAPPAHADSGYRWFSTWLGGERATAIGFTHGTLDLHGISSISARQGRLTSWALRLWRPSDMATILCCVAELDQLPDGERDHGIRALINRLAGYGEGTAVIVAGGFTADTADRLVASGWLCRVASGEDRILVAPGIGVTEHDRAHGVVDLAIRHRRQLINERRWTQPGAEVIRRCWWYQPERSARLRCSSYAEAMERLTGDTWGGGTISLEYLLQNPDGSRLTTTTGADADTAGLRPGDRVLARRFVVKSQRRTDFDDAAEALRCAWAWAAEEIVEELTLGRDPATAVQLPGDRVRIKQDWG